MTSLWCETSSTDFGRLRRISDGRSGGNVSVLAYHTTGGLLHNPSSLRLQARAHAPFRTLLESQGQFAHFPSLPSTSPPLPLCFPHPDSPPIMATAQIQESVSSRRYK
eukprot:scaffold95960_cov21-Tisochrysis_lutea.AAC.1